MKRITFISVISLLYSFFSIDAAAGSIVEFQLPSPAVAGVYIEDIITGEVLYSRKIKLFLLISHTE